MTGGRKEPGGQTGEAGETLVELLVSTSILGIVVVIILGALFTMATGTAVHSEQVTGQNALGVWAESVSASKYRDCAKPDSIPPPITLPTGFTAKVESVKYWNGSKFVSSCEDDTGLQLIELSVLAPPGSLPRVPQFLSVARRR